MSLVSLVTGNRASRCRIQKKTQGVLTATSWQRTRGGGGGTFCGMFSASHSSFQDNGVVKQNGPTPLKVGTLPVTPMKRAFLKVSLFSGVNGANIMVLLPPFPGFISQKKCSQLFATIFHGSDSKLNMN